MAEMDERYIILLRPDGDHETRQVAEEGPTLKELQEAVGGHIETVPSVLADEWTGEPGGKVIMVINEEGKLKGLPVNTTATLLSQLLFDNIVGNAVLCEAKGEDILGFTRAAAGMIRRQWKLY